MTRRSKLPRPQRIRGAIRGAVPEVVERIRMRLSETKDPDPRVSAGIGRHYRRVDASRRFRGPDAHRRWKELTHDGWVFKDSCFECGYVLSQEEQAELITLYERFPRNSPLLISDEIAQIEDQLRMAQRRAVPYRDLLQALHHFQSINPPNE